MKNRRRTKDSVARLARVIIIGKRQRSVTLLPPPTPLNFAIQNNFSDFSFTWDYYDESAEGFRIYRQAFSDPFIAVAEVGAGERVAYDAAVEPGIVYTYYMVAFNSAGVSESTDTVEGEIIPAGG